MRINLLYTEVNMAVYACITRWVLLCTMMQFVTHCLAPVFIRSNGLKLYTILLSIKFFYLSLKKKEKKERVNDRNTHHSKESTNEIHSKKLTLYLLI